VSAADALFLLEDKLPKKNYFGITDSHLAALQNLFEIAVLKEQ